MISWSPHIRIMRWKWNVRGEAICPLSSRQCNCPGPCFLVGKEVIITATWVSLLILSYLNAHSLIVVWEKI